MIINFRIIIQEYMKYIRHVIILCIICFCIAGIPVKAENVKIKKTQSAFAGLYVNNPNYNVWNSIPTGYMTYADNKYMCVYSKLTGYIYVEYYNNTFKKVFSKKIKCSLPKYGAAYYNDGYFYVVTGQSNTKENNKKPTFCITKYDEKWKKIKETKISNTLCYDVFNYGSCSIAASKDELYVYTCRQMYGVKDKTGKYGRKGNTLHHQSSYIIVLDKHTLKEKYKTGGHASHSFNQLVKEDNNKFVTIDHGDAFPRAVRLVSDNKVTDIYKFTSKTYMFGVSNYNLTGATANDLAVTDNNYLVCGISVDQKKAAKKPKLLGETNKKGNIYLITTDKNTRKSKFRWITKNRGGKISTPRFVTISKNRHLLMWNDEGCNYIYCQEINGEGKNVGRLHRYRCSKTKKRYDDYHVVTNAVTINNGRIVWNAGSNYGGKTISFCSIPYPNKSVKIATPSIKSIKNINGSAKLEWKKCSTADGYEIYKRTESSSFKKIADANDACEYVDNDVVNGETYYYTIKAYRLFDKKKYSAFNKTGWKFDNVQAVDLVNISNQHDGIMIEYNSYPNAGKYHVYRKTENTSWEMIGSTTDTYYVDTTAFDNIQYSYTVQLEVNGLLSSYGDYVLDILRVGSPKENGIRVLENGLLVSFTTDTDYFEYNIFRQKDDNPFEQIETSYLDLPENITIDGKQNIVFFDKETVPGHIYRYKVQLIVQKKIGDNIVSYTGADSDINTYYYLQRPAIQTLADTGNSINITFNKVLFAESYDIYRFDAENKENRFQKRGTINATEASTYTYVDELDEPEAANCYYYQIKANYGGYQSYFDEEVTKQSIKLKRIITLPEKYTFSLEIVDYSNEFGENRQLQLHIPYTKNVDDYIIYRVTAGQPIQVDHIGPGDDTKPGDILTWTDREAYAGNEYTYCIAVYYNGNGLCNDTSMRSEYQSVDFPL